MQSWLNPEPKKLLQIYTNSTAVIKSKTHLKQLLLSSEHN